MRATNMLVLMSDEHNPKFLGAARHSFIATPNLDALAARGTRFASAYTTCPICVPARAAFAVGRYVHDIGYWDNADGYDGAIPSWHHLLRERGHKVISIGKLHFRGLPGDVYRAATVRTGKLVQDSSPPQPSGPTGYQGTRGSPTAGVMAVAPAEGCSHSVTTHALGVSAPVNESPAFTGLSDGGRYWARTSDPQLVE